MQTIPSSYLPTWRDRAIDKLLCEVQARGVEVIFEGEDIVLHLPGGTLQSAVTSVRGDAGKSEE